LPKISFNLHQNIHAAKYILCVFFEDEDEDEDDFKQAQQGAKKGA
jgi:hypothetical protein